MHPLLEKDHQQLIDLLEALDKCVSKGQSKNQAYKYLDDFVTLAEEHFKNEEEIMETYKYPEIVDHKNEHTSLLEQLYSLRSKLRGGHTPFGTPYMNLLRNWLEDHLLDTDNKLEEFLYQVNANNNESNN
jgi:hemerythrin